MRLHVGKTMFFACKQTILGRQGNAREMRVTPGSRESCRSHSADTTSAIS